MEAQPKTSRILIVLVVLIIINLVALDVGTLNSLFYKKNAEQKDESFKALNQNEKTDKQVQTNSQVSGVCPGSCIQQIYEATSSLKLEKPSASAQTNQASSAAKEFVITFGSGVNVSDDWTDIRGAAAYVDSTKYNRIKQITFEASVFIPNGNQFTNVRLYNVTDKLVVWKSEMMHEGGEAKLLVSPSLTLASGNKLYQVQMKSQLKGPTNLDQARLRIITY